jgi:hypothetical protein
MSDDLQLVAVHCISGYRSVGTPPRITFVQHRLDIVADLLLFCGFFEWGIIRRNAPRTLEVSVS